MMPIHSSTENNKVVTGRMVLELNKILLYHVPITTGKEESSKAFTPVASIKGKNIH